MRNTFKEYFDMCQEENHEKLLTPRLHNKLIRTIYELEKQKNSSIEFEQIRKYSQTAMMQYMFKNRVNIYDIHWVWPNLSSEFFKVMEDLYEKTPN